MPPAIAIVGRPNVGKSTLFNRLTGKRAALVSDTPGLTRDRRTGEAMIAAHPVTVIDTAGLEEAPAKSIAGRMRTQSELAFANADLVLFVFDAREGVIPADAVFARRVCGCRRAGHFGGQQVRRASWSAGFLRGVPAGPRRADRHFGRARRRHGRTERCDRGRPRPEPKRSARGRVTAPSREDAMARALRVAIVGRPNAGKSTLVNALLGEERMITGPEPGLTRDAVASDLAGRDGPIRLFDTAGLRRKARIFEAAEKLAPAMPCAPFALPRWWCCWWTPSIPSSTRISPSRIWLKPRGVRSSSPSTSGTWWPTSRAMLKQLRATLAERLAQMPGVCLVPISALAGRGLQDLMTAVLHAYEIWNKRVPTPDLNRWLAEALEQHAPAASKGRRVKLRFMTQPSARPPTFIAFCSRPEALQKAYLRYLSNSLRTAFGFPGVPIRLKLRKSANPFARG